ncbi:hypothetical protein CR513_00816, partial [Mucuna pruriens]
MEVAFLRTNILESNKETVTCFLHGLNKDIQDVVELYHYTSIDDLVHQAMKALKRFYPNSFEEGKEKSPKKGSLLSQGQEKEKMLLVLVPASKSSSIKCFKCLGKGHIASQCPNKRSMILGEDKTVDNKSSQDKSLSISETGSFISDFSPNDGDLLMVRCLMCAYVREDDDSQRKNIFHLRCHVLGKLCSIIIDDSSYASIASFRLVEKLNLPTLVHPKPYKLQWLNNKREMAITNDKVLCDVVPMKATPILLGRSWQYYLKVNHDRVTNRFSFMHNEQKVTLKPLSPKEVMKVS